MGDAASAIFIVPQLVPIPGLTGVRIGKESYLMLAIWIVLGILFYLFKNKDFDEQAS